MDRADVGVRLISGLINKEKIFAVKSNVDSISDEQILDRQRGLNFVGLDFNFKE